jgi:archaellum biogenesis protein FlaJ (TadC family)
MQQAVPILVPLFSIIFIAAVILVPQILRTAERMTLIATARRASERGETLPLQLLETLKAEEESKPTPERDLRRGAVLVAVALAFIILAGLVEADDGRVVFPLIGFAAFPGLIGLVYIAFWFANRNKRAH